MDADLILLGEHPGDYAGFSVASGGDVDGDGITDIAVGAPQSYEEPYGTGLAYVVSGGMSGSHSLDQAPIRFVGEDAYDETGKSVAVSLADGGDGGASILIGAPGAREAEIGFGEGAAYLFHDIGTGDYSVTAADVHLAGDHQADFLGNAITAGVDLDQDGTGDFAVGAYGYTGTTPETVLAGAVYLFLDPMPQSGPVGTSADVHLQGSSTGARAGTSVAFGGDLNGDGLPDLLIGEPCQTSDCDAGGAVYVITQFAQGSSGLNDASIRIVTDWEHLGLGRSVASSGDVNGDGFDDLLVGTMANEAYLFYGPLQGTNDLEQADVAFIGEDGADYAGLSVAGAGDVNGDGYADLLIGAPRLYEGEGSGKVYLIYGEPSEN